MFNCGHPHVSCNDIGTRYIVGDTGIICIICTKLYIPGLALLFKSQEFVSLSPGPPFPGKNQMPVNARRNHHPVCYCVVVVDDDAEEPLGGKLHIHPGSFWQTSWFFFWHEEKENTFPPPPPLPRQVKWKNS